MVELNWTMMEELLVLETLWKHLITENTFIILMVKLTLDVSKCISVHVRCVTVYVRFRSLNAMNWFDMNILFSWKSDHIPLMFSLCLCPSVFAPLWPLRPLSNSHPILQTMSASNFHSSTNSLSHSLSNMHTLHTCTQTCSIAYSLTKFV